VVDGQRTGGSTSGGVGVQLAVAEKAALHLGLLDVDGRGFMAAKLLEMKSWGA